jgi:hypothetical protein
MVGADHVGLLVCNAFNVSISRESIRPDFRFVETVRRKPRRAVTSPVAHIVRARPLAATTARGWRAPATARTSSAAARTSCSLSKGALHCMRLAKSDVQCSCGVLRHRMQDSEELLSLSGALLGEGTGSVAYLQQHPAEAPAGGDGEEERQRRKRERRAARAAAAAAAEAAAVEVVAAEEAPQEVPQEAPQAEAGGSRKKRKGEQAAPAETLAEEAGEAPRKHKKKHKSDRGDKHRDDAANGDVQ